MSGWVYIMTNRRNGTLYTGVTSNLAARIWQHRTGTGSVFTRRYRLKMLVYAEPHDRIEQAIHREKTIKNWPRARKVRLIEMENPEWRDLFDQIVG
jgi:putative endonuclease